MLFREIIVVYRENKLTQVAHMFTAVLSIYEMKVGETSKLQKYETKRGN
jgi:hypothetical protein